MHVNKAVKMSNRKSLFFLLITFSVANDSLKSHKTESPQYAISKRLISKDRIIYEGVIYLLNNSTVFFSIFKDNSIPLRRCIIYPSDCKQKEHAECYCLTTGQPNQIHFFLNFTNVMKLSTVTLNVSDTSGNTFFDITEQTTLVPEKISKELNYLHFLWLLVLVPIMFPPGLVLFSCFLNRRILQKYCCELKKLSQRQKALQNNKHSLFNYQNRMISTVFQEHLLELENNLKEILYELNILHGKLDEEKDPMQYLLIFQDFIKKHTCIFYLIIALNNFVVNKYLTKKVENLKSTLDSLDVVQAKIESQLSELIKLSKNEDPVERYQNVKDNTLTSREIDENIAVIMEDADMFEVHDIGNLLIF